MGRPRKFKTPNALLEKWNEYKADCENRFVLRHEFSAKNSEFISKELRHSVTVTIEGFCRFAGISRRCFYEYYANDSRFGDTVTRMREECEVDAREKFETGQIPPQLAALRMGNHGYGANAKVDVNTNLADEWVAAMMEVDDKQ